jgi:hypothetical protein
MLDGGGVQGHLLDFSLTIAFAGSALLLFLYLWWNDRLDMGEEPKETMLIDSEEDHGGVI